MDHDNVYGDVINSLTDKGFQGDILQDDATLEEFSRDESIFSVRPHMVLAPKDAEDVSRVVNAVRDNTKTNGPLSLTPRAAGSGLSGGSLNDSIAIDVMRHMNHVGEVTHHPDRSTITLGPGVWFRDIEKRLKEQGFYIPVYPASKDLCAIGGMIGNNCAGAESLTYGHFVEWVDSLDVVLSDGNVYTLKPWTWEEVQSVMQYDNELARITRDVFFLIEENEEEINLAKPTTKKNTAGYPLWDVISTSVQEFKQGNGTFDLIRIFAGSQGTLGIITSADIKLLPLPGNYNLMVVPVFDLDQVGNSINALLEHNPFTVELFDDKTFRLALTHPSFFKDRLDDDVYPQILDSMYQTYFGVMQEKVPAFTILASFSNDVSPEHIAHIAGSIKEACSCDAHLVNDPIESEMFWQIRRASYTLSKLQDPSKRPAAFLEDMIVPPGNLPAFFRDIKQLFEKYDVEAAVHGHGGNGHLHFYPLLDFTDPETPGKVLDMMDDFFAAAVKHGGGICGEHNDGIVRTPYLDTMYSISVLGYFRSMEHIFDPQDIFNPGKKVNQKFNLQDNMRKIN